MYIIKLSLCYHIVVYWIYIWFFPYYFHFLQFFLSAELGIKREHEVFFFGALILKLQERSYEKFSFLNTMCYIIVWDFWLSKWHWEGISFDYAVSSRQYYSADRSYSFIPLPSEVYNLRNWQCRSWKLSLSLCIIIYKLNWRGIVIWSSMRRC